MNLALVLEQTKRDTVDGCVTPSLIEETTSAVQVIEVVLVDLATPKVHVGNLKVAPEVASRVTLGLLIVTGAALLISHPLESIVLVQVVGVLRNELAGLGPQGGNRLGRIVEVDCEAICLVVVLHIAEHIVVDVAEEVNFRLDAPIELGVLEGRVLVKETAVPSAHLVIRQLVGVLDVVFLEDLHGLGVEIVVDPRRLVPVLSRDDLW